MGIWTAPALAQETSFHAAGYGNAGFDAPLDGDPAGFSSAAFNPIFLWREGDRILLENEIAIADSEDGIEIALEYATVDLDLGGPVLVVGKFLSPSGQFISRLHPSWINKLPDFPLAYRLGVTPMNHLGASLQHAVHLTDRQKLTGLVYLTNGAGETEAGDPSLMARPGDLSGAFGVGGRLGLFVLPQLELGGSLWTSEYGHDLDERYTLWVGDFAFTELDGFDLRGEFVQARWGEQQAMTGAWGQAAYRLQTVQPLRWLEPVTRFGWASGDTPGAMEMEMASLDIGDVLPISAGHDSGAELELGDEPAFEMCFGANAWLRSNVVAKFAYVHRVEEYQPTLRAQLAFGY